MLVSFAFRMLHDLEKHNMIRIPIRLVSESNCSQHWTKKSKRHRTHKMLVNAFLDQHCPIALPCVVILTRYAPRYLDWEDNLPMAFKWVKDAIAQHILGGLPGQKDSDARITWKYNQEKTEDKEYYITIQIGQCMQDQPSS